MPEPQDIAQPDVQRESRTSQNWETVRSRVKPEDLKTFQPNWGDWRDSDSRRTKDSVLLSIR